MRSELRGWLPHQLRQGEGAADCRWLYFGNAPFTDPFFEDTISRCLSLPENSFAPPRITRVDELPEVAAECDALEPSAFVFHVSRCGSTLVSQLLGLDASCVTLSEVPFFDQLLRARFQPAFTSVAAATLLPAAMRLHGQRRTGEERSLVVKLDSWHAGFHSELRAMYPRTPFILLYRDPVAVVRSHTAQPGMQAVRGVIEDEVFGISAEEGAALPPHAHLPRVLALYYEKFLAIARTDPRSLLVPYQADMMPAVDSIARFAGIAISETHREKMRARAAFHAKRPQEDFREADAGVAGSALAECVARYEVLERFRQGAGR